MKFSVAIYLVCWLINLIFFQILNYDPVDLVPFLLNLVAGALLGGIFLYYTFRKDTIYPRLRLTIALVTGCLILVLSVKYKFYLKSTGLLANQLYVSMLFQLLPFTKLVFLAFLRSIFS